MVRLFAATGIALLALLTYRGARRASVAATPAPAAPRSLQTWEGEGGGVPASATQTVAQVPAASDETGGPLGVRA